jgi:alpha-glucuronidase
MRTHFKFILIIIIILSGNLLRAEDGYKLWLRYAPLAESESAEEILRQVYIPDSHETFKIIKEEISRAAEGMIGQEIKFASAIAAGTSLIIGTPESIPKLREDRFSDRLKQLATEGYFVEYSNDVVYVCANTPVGALYGTFHLLRLIQSNGEISNLLPIEESPKIKRRILNHWDNLDRTVERGYAGFSIWNWHTLPDYIGTRYIDYARANASIGINGTVLTNVNANALVLTPQYLEKVSALAKVFRPYGIKVYLTARFSSPIEIGDLETADPMVPEVRQWWKDKVDEIYEKIPDFGGFLVKANSEGQPGPQNYDRTHADGANMLALALAPHGGIVIWRAFVYSHEVPEDRAKQANNEFEFLI